VRRWIPSLPLAAGLWALWLLLNDSVAPGQLLLGWGVALIVPPLVVKLRPSGPRLHSALVLARLVACVGVDVVLSALEVAAGILRSAARPPRPAFVKVPLDLRDAHGLAALAMITAVVPGTVWCELSTDRSELLIHVFDLAGEAAFIAHYKARYELPLREIFE
jgi:multicomponent K+:H+ antiporter subunit E